MITMENKIMRDCTRRQISLQTMLRISRQLNYLDPPSAMLYSDYLVMLLSQSRSEHEFCERMEELEGYYD